MKSTWDAGRGPKRASTWIDFADCAVPVAVDTVDTSFEEEKEEEEEGTLDSSAASSA